jgi:leucine-rich repeat/coiled-coil domain-containing protein 1
MTTAAQDTAAQLQVAHDTVRALTQREMTARQALTEQAELLREQQHALADLHRVYADLRKQSEALAGQYRHAVETAKTATERAHAAEKAQGQARQQVQALETVLTGLRGERELWGKELATQGAMLAADHGRLVVRAEALERDLTKATASVAALDEALRLKTKITEDQGRLVLGFKKRIK